MVFEQTSGDSEGQKSLMCCSPWGHKESDVTYQLNNKSKQIFTPRKLYLLTLFCIHLLHRHQPPRRYKSPIKQTKSSNLIQPTILLRNEWVRSLSHVWLFAHLYLVSKVKNDTLNINAIIIYIYITCVCMCARAHTHAKLLQSGPTPLYSTHGL